RTVDTGGTPMASEIVGSFAFRKTGDDGSVTTVITEFWSPDRYGVCYATYTTYSVPVPGSAKAQRIAAGLDRLEPGYSVEKVEGGLSALRRSEERRVGEGGRSPGGGWG